MQEEKPLLWPNHLNATDFSARFFSVDSLSFSWAFNKDPCVCTSYEMEIGTHEHEQEYHKQSNENDLKCDK